MVVENVERVKFKVKCRSCSESSKTREPTVKIKVIMA